MRAERNKARDVVELATRGFPKGGDQPNEIRNHYNSGFERFVTFKDWFMGLEFRAREVADGVFKCVYREGGRAYTC